jgi:hypothetical protein
MNMPITSAVWKPEANACAFSVFDADRKKTQ